MMMGQCSGHSHKMVVLPALSRPSTRIRASFSPKIDSRRETHSPIPAARRGDQATTRPCGLSGAVGLAQQAHTLLGNRTQVPAKQVSRQLCLHCHRLLLRDQLKASCCGLSDCWGGLKSVGLFARFSQRHRINKEEADRSLTRPGLIWTEGKSRNLSAFVAQLVEHPFSNINTVLKAAEGLEIEPPRKHSSFFFPPQQVRHKTES